MEEQEFMPSSLEVDELAGLVLVRCRDLMIERFFELHKQMATIPGNWMSLAGPAENYSHTTVMGTIRMLFSELEEDFRRPTASGLTKVLARLAVKAAAWGIPENAIQQTRRQLQRLIDLAWDGPERR